MNKDRRECKPGSDRLQSICPAGQSHAKMPVMVVDDDKGMLKIICTMLTHHGFEVTRSDNAYHALGCLQEKGFHCVITDFQMPGMDGLTLASTIKKTHPETIVVLMTGVDREDLEKEQGVENIDFYIQKPVRVQVLLKAIGKKGPQ